MNQQRLDPDGLPSADSDGMDIELQQPSDFLVRLESNIAAAGGELEPDENRVGSVGATMFDVPNSEDNSLTVLLPRDNLQSTPSQALVRIKSADGRDYL